MVGDAPASMTPISLVPSRTVFRRSGIWDAGGVQDGCSDVCKQDDANFGLPGSTRRPTACSKSGTSVAQRYGMFLSFRRCSPQRTPLSDM